MKVVLDNGHLSPESKGHHDKYCWCMKDRTKAVKADGEGQ